jgi:obg-like ATPase 1
LQAVDGIFHLVRAFKNNEVIHVEDSVDPVRDMETITSELCAKDSVYVEQMRAAKEMELKRNPKMKLPPVFFTVMDRVKELLESNNPIGKADWTAEEIEKINEIIPLCITTKPMIYIVNIGKQDFIRGGNRYLADIKAWVKSHGGGLVIPVSVDWEEELSQLTQSGDEEVL